MKLIFAGTPEFAAAALAALSNSRHTVLAVLTQPDRPSGRGMKLVASPVKKLALALGLPVLQPTSLRAPEAQPLLRKFDADVLVVAAYGLILPQAILDIAPSGAINIHASLLPRWRGAAPIQRAILAGDKQTGICIMRMDAGLDTGPVLLKERVDIADQDTGGTLHDKLSKIGARLVVTALDRLESNELDARPQPADGATYASKIEKSEAHLDWSRPAEDVWRRIRAFDPHPGASSAIRGEWIKLYGAGLESGLAAQPGEILEAGDDGVVVACGRGAVRILELQRAGGRRLSAKDFLRGLTLSLGGRFGA